MVKPFTLEYSTSSAFRQMSVYHWAKSTSISVICSTFFSFAMFITSLRRNSALFSNHVITILARLSIPCIGCFEPNEPERTSVPAGGGFHDFLYHFPGSGGGPAV